jgi:choline kinase
MKAVILAGGIGSRLRPLTERTPKCLLKVGGITLLDRQLSVLNGLGITAIAIVTGHEAQKIIDHVQGRGVTIIHNPDFETTNNAYSLWLARDFVSEDKDGFIVCNSDLIFTPNMLRSLLESPVADGMIVDDAAVDMTSDMVKVQLKEGDRIYEMSKQLDTSLASAEAVGPVLFSQKGGAQFMTHIDKAIGSGDRKNWFFYTLSQFAKYYPFHAVRNKGHMWAEIDTVQDLQDAVRRSEMGHF